MPFVGAINWKWMLIGVVVGWWVVPRGLALVSNAKAS